MKRSPVAALWLSLLPGAGHIYLGQTSKGFLLILLVAGAIQLVDRGADGFGVVIAFLWLYGMIDAYRSAHEHNHLVETGQPLPKPAAFTFSRWWGWALVGLGAVFFVDNFGWLDIDWLWDLWPLGLIGLGVFILKRPEVSAIDGKGASPPPLTATPVAESSGWDTSDTPIEPVEPTEPDEPDENASSMSTEEEAERDG